MKHTAYTAVSVYGVCQALLRMPARDAMCRGNQLAAPTQSGIHFWVYWVYMY